MISLAWLRAVVFSLLLLASPSSSREDTLFTSSVTYCTPPESLLIQQFDVAYFPRNQTVFFNISAASVSPNVNVSANLLVNVYGLNPINVTIDLCGILGGALCPLPMYNFTGSDSLTLPDSLGISGRIPEIAFKIPDLEGFAQLVLTEVGTGAVKACVQSTLSNGWSMHQPAVEWTTGGVALAALLSAAWQSPSPTALVPYRLLDLLSLYQIIASTSFLSLNYPQAYRAFTLNFAWAMGLFPASPTSSFQRSIDNMRHQTGGALADAGTGSAVGLVNRKLSPYNIPGSNNFAASPSLISRGLSIFDHPGFTKLDFARNSTDTDHLLLANLASPQQLAVPDGVQTVTAVSSNVLQAGIPIYVNSIYIATANAFMTIFLVALIIIAIALAAAALGHGFILIMQRTRRGQQIDLKSHYISLVRAWSLRIGLVMLAPLVIFIFYQWTLKDSWLSILLSVIAFFAILGLILYPIFLTLRLAARSTPYALFSHDQHLAAYGSIYAQYRLQRYIFFLVPLIALFLKAIIIAFAHGHGEAQIIIITIIEGFVVIAHFVLRPAKTKGGDVFSTFLAIVRLVCTALMIAFIERLAVDAIPRTVIGLVIAVIFSVTVIIVIINLVIHAGLDRIWRHYRSSRTSTRQGSAVDASMLEKGGDQGSSGSSVHVERPINPTPERNVPLDPHINQPYPIITPTTTAGHSFYTGESESITVGSLLPRRWSFSPPNSPTDSLQIRDPSSPSSTNTGIHGRISGAPSQLHQ